MEAVLRACDLLRAFHTDAELLRLRDFLHRTSLSKSTVHRLLKTLEHAGLVERIGTDQYRSCVRVVSRSPIRIGFAGQTTRESFAREVAQSVSRSARGHGVDLLEVDNRYSAKAALKNAELLIRQRPSVVIEFQTYENVAPAIASRFLEAGIPVIAVEIPHPGAVYFGANNYNAGLIAGRALGKWAKENWRGTADEIILLEERIAGPLPQQRLTGALAGIREVLPHSTHVPVTRYDVRGSLAPALDTMRKHLKSRSARRTLVAGINDPSALGALRAFEESGRVEHCAVVGQNALPEAREELRRSVTRLIGTVAFFPERYGDELIPLAMTLASGKTSAPAVFIKHLLITSRNVDSIYPPE